MLKLEFDELLSSFAFNVNLRRYTVGIPAFVLPAAAFLVGAYIRSLLT